MNSVALALTGLSFRYGRSAPLALEIDALHIHGGETVALVGRNGSGKSTLLMSLAGLLKPQKGERLCAIAQERIAFVFQNPCLDKKLTVAENLSLFGKVWGLKHTEIQAALEKLNPALQLEELLNRPVGSLSGGQQRRADLARALILEPQILFLDEPTVGLDLIAQREFWSVLAESRKTRPALTLICASHHAAELKLFERILFLNKGKIALDIEQKSLLGILPSETLEVNTLGSAEKLQHEFQKITRFSGSVVAHDKLLIHSENASGTMEEINKYESLQTQVESVLVRKTRLSDAVWQRLLQISDGAGAHSHEGAAP